MSDESKDRGYPRGDPDDIEELIAPVRKDADPSPQERWNSQAALARVLMAALPGARVSCGEGRSRRGAVDYITPAPNAPLTVFGPDGRFIVSFLEDGRWVEADGRFASMSQYVEGSLEAVARSLIRTAGLELAGDMPLHHGWRRPANPDRLPRMLAPKPTRTWRDHIQLPVGQRWDEDTPASICRESSTSRLIAVSYDESSCTYSKSPHPRWGIESLRIPDLSPDQQDPTFPSPLAAIHIGDCLLTVGRKLEARQDQLPFDREADGVHMWFPQRVLHIEPEGAGHLRVWLLWDKDVSNDHVVLDELATPVPIPDRRSRILTSDETFSIWQSFQLDVFCPVCGNRAKPIMYGMAASPDPSYLAIGGCVIEANQPRYICSCGNAWTDIQEMWA